MPSSTSLEQNNIMIALYPFSLYKCLNVLTDQSSKEKLLFPKSLNVGATKKFEKDFLSISNFLSMTSVMVPHD
jgi:hypothetical protein